MQSRYPPPNRGEGQRADLFSEKGREELIALMTPRTVVSLAIWLLMFSLGAGLSGLLFFAIYQGQLNAVEERLIKSQEELNKRIDERLKRSAGGAEGAPEFRSSSVRPGENDEAAQALEELLATVGPSLAVIDGMDASGAPTTGSGFVINTTGDEAWILTNEHLVAGAVGNFKTVRVRLGGIQVPSEVYSSDAARDLALVIFRGGSARALRFVPEPPKEGDPVWAAGTAKGTRGSVLSGVLKEATPSSLVTDVAAPPHFTGGPLLNRDGRVLGVLSIKPPAPGTEAAGNVAVPIELACVEVVRCPSRKPTPSPSPTGRSGARRESPSPGQSPTPAGAGGQSPEPQLTGPAPSAPPG